MGIAAYERGSKVIRDGITRDYMERGGRRKQLLDQLTRAEQSIVDLEQYCRDAQALYVDARDPNTATGLLKNAIYHAWIRKQTTKRFSRLQEECLQSHIAWVHSDIRQSISHLQVCYRKARAWHEMLNYLNTRYRLPFSTPAHL